MIVGFISQVGYVVDGDVLHVAIVAPGTQSCAPKFQLQLCPAKMRQQRLALAARMASAISSPTTSAPTGSEPEIDARIELVTGLRVPKGMFEMFLFAPTY